MEYDGTEYNASQHTTCGQTQPDAWRFRMVCVATHNALKHGLLFVDETHGGDAQHYGWPKRSVGVEWSWRCNTWFVGWELWAGGKRDVAKSAVRND